MCFSANGLQLPSDREKLQLLRAERQRDIAADRDMVCEGRDQGTVAFPDAFCKFFLTADPSERARRRNAREPHGNPVRFFVATSII